MDQHNIDATIKIRRVIHFSGFEPLGFSEHHGRYERALAKSAATFGFAAKVGPIVWQENAPSFEVEASGPNWRTQTTVTILDHCSIVQQKLGRPLWLSLCAGFHSAFLVIIYGGLFGYLKTAWRFAAFFLFPFLLLLAGLVISLGIGVLPYWFGPPFWLFVISLPLAFVFLGRLFLPFAKRFHTLLLAADWDVTMDLVTGRNRQLNELIERFSESLENALAPVADEYVISSHSMGSAMMIEALGTILMSNPAALSGKTIVICSMGGGGLQCTLLKPARIMRQKALLILNNPNVRWMDVQCLTDVANFYKTGFCAANKFKSSADTQLILIRVKSMVSKATYRRIKNDLLRVHRQFVLGSEQRSPFDFGLLTAGPFPAIRFTRFINGKLPPLSENGTMIGGVVGA